MTEPVDYQTPLPHGRNLRYQSLPDGIRIARDAVSRSALWREFIIPTVAISLFSACILHWVWELIRPRYPGLLPLQRVMYVVGIFGFALILVYVIRDAWQNAGIVTEIAVTKGTLYWRKQTLWGTSEHFWPLTIVRHASVDSVNRVLKIRRRRGASLGAFAFHGVAELSIAAAQLNDAIEKNRTDQPLD